MMTVKDVEARVAEIRALAHDPEAAHSREDSLWAEVLDTIASGWSDDPRNLAYAALQTQKIEFARWCA
jgi:hypothetical protein